MDKDIIMHIVGFILGFLLGIMVSINVLNTQETEVKTTELQQKYEEYVKENEWKNEYIEWLQDQLYEKYEEVE